MEYRTPYIRPPVIGQISLTSPEERTREGDRWVALRTIARRPTPIQEQPSAIDADAPATAPRRPVLYEAVLQRHMDARRRMGW